MKQIAVYSPFGASIFVSHTVNLEWGAVWYWRLGIQALWILALGILLKFILSRASKRLSVNGG